MQDKQGKDVPPREQSEGPRWHATAGEEAGNFR